MALPELIRLLPVECILFSIPSKAFCHHAAWYARPASPPTGDSGKFFSSLDKLMGPSATRGRAPRRSQVTGGFQMAHCFSFASCPFGKGNHPTWPLDLIIDLGKIDRFFLLAGPGQTLVQRADRTTEQMSILRGFSWLANPPSMANRGVSAFLCYSWARKSGYRSATLR